MSGPTSVPEALPPPLPPGKSDLTTDVDHTITLLCETAEGLTKPLPFGLSKYAAAEIRSYCAHVARKAERYTGELKAVAWNRWSLISDETKTELAELAKRAASPYQAPPPEGWTEKPLPDVGDFTKGVGRQFKLSIPVKFASHTDVKLLINTTDPKSLKLEPPPKLLKELKLYDVGVEVTQPWTAGPFKGEFKGSVLINTSEPVRPSGFIKIYINLDR